MFKLQTNPTFKRSVTVVTPTDNGDTKGTFTATFNRLPQSRIDQILADRMDGDSDSSILDEVLANVDGIADENGNAMPSNDETLNLVKDDSCARIALVSEYFSAITKKNQRKN